MHIDHHLQAQIVDQLWSGTHSFSELKPAHIENSLFMYHLRRLIARGIVEKTDAGYRLTPEGTRWAHKRDHLYQREVGLRMLVQLFVVRDGMLLVSERQGATAEHMNRYLLPSALHKFGMTSEQCIDTLSAKIGAARGELMTQIETILPSENLHTISDIYIGTPVGATLPDDEEHYHYQWIELGAISKMSISEAGALPILTSKYLDRTLKPRELLSIP